MVGPNTPNTSPAERPSEFTPEALATQALTLIADNYFAHSPHTIPIIEGSDAEANEERVYLAVPVRGPVSPTGTIAAATRKLVPRMLTRTTHSDGVRSYSLIDENSANGRGIVWESDPASEATTPPAANGHSSAGYRTEQIKKLSDRFAGSYSYDPKTHEIVRGRRVDKIRPRGLLAKLGQRASR